MQQSGVLHEELGQVPAPRTAAARDVDPPAATPAPDVDTRPVLTGAVDVLVDGSGRLGALSYLVPAGLEVRLGDAVQVPFGKRTAHGVVIGAGSPEKATRELELVFGRRSDPRDIEVAARLAAYHACEFSAVAARLSPRSGRGADPLAAGPVVLVEAPEQDALVARRMPADSAAPVRVLLRAPLIHPARLAATAAAEMAARTGGQVLVVCPTLELVTQVLAQFSSGAARIDSKARKGAWRGFEAGTVTIGIVTRAGVLFAADRLAGLVVVEEDHPGHFEQTVPAWNARDVAVARACARGAELVLTSAFPTPAAMGAGTPQRHLLGQYVGGSQAWPTLRVADRSQMPPGQRLVPPAAAAALTRADRAGRPVVVVVSRRAAVRRCARCSAPRPCPQECGSSLCRHADTTSCSACGDTSSGRVRGWDAERVAPLFRGAAVVTTADLPALMHDGLSRTVIVFDIDGALAVPEMVPGGVATRLIAAAAAAAGLEGELVVCTDDATQPLLAEIGQRRDLRPASRRAYAAAKMLHLPPFGRLVTVRLKRKTAPNLRGWPGVVHGPRKVADDQWEALIRVPNAELGPLLDKIRQVKKSTPLRVTVQ